MRLYLVRHATPNSEEIDPERGLSDQGKLEAQRVAAFLKPLEIRVENIRHSSKKRAAQTADILGTSVISNEGIFERAGISPMDPVTEIKNELESSRQDLMLVGHLPFMGRLVSALVAGSDSADLVDFLPGTCACLVRTSPGAWHIGWMITPELVGNV